jgi:hypothetical protein
MIETVDNLDTSNIHNNCDLQTCVDLGSIPNGQVWSSQPIGVPLLYDEKSIWQNDLPYLRSILIFINSIQVQHEWQFNNKAMALRWFFELFDKVSGGKYVEQPFIDFDKLCYAFWVDKMQYLHNLMRKNIGNQPVIEILLAFEAEVLKKKFAAREMAGKEASNG